MRTAILVLTVIALCKSLPIKNIVQSNTENDDEKESVISNVANKTESVLKLERNSVRPGMAVTRYNIVLEPHVESGTFSGLAEIDLIVTDADTREDEILLHSVDLNINSVTFSISGGTAINVADFTVEDDDGLLSITTNRIATTYRFFIEYTGNMIPGFGLYSGNYDFK